MAPLAAAAAAREPPSSYMGASELDEEHRQAFFSTAGALAVVDGVEFAFHKDILARQSKARWEGGDARWLCRSMCLLRCPRSCPVLLPC